MSRFPLLTGFNPVTAHPIEHPSNGGLNCHSGGMGGEYETRRCGRCPVDLARLEDVVGRHLLRFGARDELHVRWSRSDGQPGTEQYSDPTKQGA
jgi:hypothetical protein